MLPVETPPWYEVSNPPMVSGSEGVHSGTLKAMLMRRALKDRRAVWSVASQGAMSPDLARKLLKELSVLPGAFCFQAPPKEVMKDNGGTVSMAWLVLGDEFTASISVYDTSGAFSLHTTDDKIRDLALEMEKLIPEDEPEPNLIYAIAQASHGPQLTAVGSVGLPLVKENYALDIIELYQHVVGDFAMEEPCGRLVVMSGTPGTGKTFLVRGLINSTEKGTFVLVPPHMIHSLGDPATVRLLISHKEQAADDEPLILVLEDADAALVPRGTDNMHSISGLLNLSDGLLGRALDIRIVATTNAVLNEMDEALMRPGRLCRHISTKSLEIEQVKALCKKLAPDKESLSTKATLAEIYKWAKSSDLPSTKKLKTSGFGR